MATNNANDFSNPIAISQGGTNAASMGTTDGVVYYDGTRLVTTNAGTAAQLLTSNGPGLAPTWQSSGGSGSPSGIGWDLIQSQTLIAGDFILVFTGITNAYNIYKLVISHGNNPNIWLRYSTNGGVSYVSSGYKSCYGSQRLTAGGISPFPMITDPTQVTLTRRPGGSSYAGTNSMTAYLFNVTNGANCIVQGFGSSPDKFDFPFAAMNNAAAINALQVTFNLSGGNNVVSLYGLNES
jgi:hypothetical protein